MNKGFVGKYLVAGAELDQGITQGKFEVSHVGLWGDIVKLGKSVELCGKVYLALSSRPHMVFKWRC